MRRERVYEVLIGITIAAIVVVILMMIPGWLE